MEGPGAQQVELESSNLSLRIRDLHPNGVDAVLDLIGNSVVLDSRAMVRRDGRVCAAGFLDGLAPLASFNPLLQMPSGVLFSFFGSFVFGTPEFPLSDVPLPDIFDRAAHDGCKAKPARVLGFEDIEELIA